MLRRTQYEAEIRFQLMQGVFVESGQALVEDPECSGKRSQVAKPYWER